MKAGLWSRVSTNKQEREAQELQLLEYAKNRGYSIVEIYSEIRSGSATGMNEWNRMMKDARARKFDILLTWSVDRLSRKGPIEILNILKKLKDFGVMVESLQEPLLSTTDPAIAEIVIFIMGWIARWERGRISERTKAGLERARKKGVRLGRPKGKKDMKPRKRRWKKRPASEWIE